jgi:hypothetical protein
MKQVPVCLIQKGTFFDDNPSCLIQKGMYSGTRYTPFFSSNLRKVVVYFNYCLQFNQYVNLMYIIIKCLFLYQTGWIIIKKCPFLYQTHRHLFHAGPEVAVSVSMTKIFTKPRSLTILVQFVWGGPGRYI